MSLLNMLSRFVIAFLPRSKHRLISGNVIWYSYLFKNFPWFVVIHIVKGFSVDKEAEVDVFLQFSCFFYDPTDGGNLISSSSAFLILRLNFKEFWFVSDVI